MQSLERKHPTAHRHVHTRTHTYTHEDERVHFGRNRRSPDEGNFPAGNFPLSLADTRATVSRRGQKEHRTGSLIATSPNFAKSWRPRFPAICRRQQSTLAISSRSRIAELFHWRGWIVPRLRNLGRVLNIYRGWNLNRGFRMVIYTFGGEDQERAGWDYVTPKKKRVLSRARRGFRNLAATRCSLLPESNTVHRWWIMGIWNGRWCGFGRSASKIVSVTKIRKRQGYFVSLSYDFTEFKLKILAKPSTENVELRQTNKCTILFKKVECLKRSLHPLLYRITFVDKIFP